MNNTFFAMLFRMKYISRWGLMRCNFPENLSEHSLEVALLSHALAAIGNSVFGKSYDCPAICVKALYHDAPEILTGDLPTPVKYHSADTKKAYDTVEEAAKQRFWQSLPEELRGEFKDIFSYTEEERRIIKAADKLSALIKCKAELDSGNREFEAATKSVGRALEEMKMPEVEYFTGHFLDTFSLPVDLI